MNMLSKLLPVLLLSSVLTAASAVLAAEGESEAQAALVSIEAAQGAASESLQLAQEIAAESLQKAQEMSEAAGDGVDKGAYDTVARTLQSFVQLGVLDLNSEDELPDLASIAEEAEYIAWATAENIEDPKGFLDSLVRLEMLYFIYGSSFADQADAADLQQQANDIKAEVEDIAVMKDESAANNNAALEALVAQTNEVEVASEDQDSALQIIKEIEAAVAADEQLAEIQAQGLNEIQASNDALVEEMESLSGSLMALFSDDEKQLIEQNYEDYSQIRNAAGLNN
ncbi:MAG: hypothetical protein HQ497_10950 [SAR86 cluster bacterium]|uniref:Uncharacterized protein n=1 Tax=SAR86 cluster bacterium TaxID=2030880 RepID=A0A972VX24_9GAMM|nr:hypothetical protein [SAR86 cluster bacterium]